MEIKKIYFDMDGVLADFDRGVVELCGLQWPPIDPQDQTADQMMWDRASKVPHFYDRLELMPGANEMFGKVYGKYRDRVEILTGIPKPHRGMVGAAEDKRAWVRRILSKDIVVNTVFKEEKPRFCTGKDCILIDDLKRNFDAWEAMGGTGILHVSAEDTLKKLSSIEE